MPLFDVVSVGSEQCYSVTHQNIPNNVPRHSIGRDSQVFCSTDFLVCFELAYLRDRNSAKNLVARKRIISFRQQVCYIIVYHLPTLPTFCYETLLDL